MTDVKLPSDTEEKPIMEEVIPLEKWPRLAPSNNKTKIDYTHALNIRIDALSYLPEEILQRSARALGIPIETKKETIIKTIKNIVQDVGAHILPFNASAEDIIFTHLDRSILQTFLFSHGQARIEEIRYSDGNLRTRILFGKELDSYTEIYGEDGLLLESFATEAESVAIMGPYYNANAGAPHKVTRTITYYIDGEQVSKQEWSRYIDGAKTLTKESKALNYNVSSLIDSYTAF